MALVLMSHAKTHSSQPSSILSPQNYLYDVLNPPFCPLLFTLFYFGPSFCFLSFSYCPLAPADLSLPPPPLILCTKFLNDASFTLYLSLEGSEVWALSTQSRRGTGRGYQYYKRKAISYCSPSFLFSTMGS